MAQGVFSLNEVRTEQVSNIANKDFASWPESATYGYYGGGASAGSYPVPGSVYSLIQRLDYFTESATTLNSFISPARANVAATSSSSYGYFAGGAGQSSSPYINRAQVDQIGRAHV